MPDDHFKTHPTPVSGMPAQVATTSAAKPSLKPEEIVSPNSRSGDMSTILQTLSRIEHRTDNIESKIDREFKAQAVTNESFSKALGTVTDEVSQLRVQYAQIADAQVATAKASAEAAGIAVRAMAMTSTAQDDTAKMVESAMHIQKGAIAAEVATAIKPIASDVDALKTASKDLQDTAAVRGVAIEKLTEATGAIVNELGIEDQVQLGRSVPPHEKLPPPKLQRMDRNAKWAAIGAAATTGGLFIKLLIDLLAPHH